MIVTYTNKSMFDSFLSKLCASSKITLSDEFCRMLGFQIERTVDGDILCINLSIRLCKAGAYRVESSYRLRGEQPTETTADTEFATAHKLNAWEDSAGPCMIAHPWQYFLNFNMIFLKNKKPYVSYREVIRCLFWVSMDTKPDVTYAVNQCAWYLSDVKSKHGLLLCIYCVT